MKIGSEARESIAFDGVCNAPGPYTSVAYENSGLIMDVHILFRK